MKIEAKCNSVYVTSYKQNCRNAKVFTTTATSRLLQ